MYLLLLFVSAKAFWPFDSTLDQETSTKLLVSTLKEIGHSDEESQLITKAFLEANQQISVPSLVAQIQDRSFSKFISSWKRNLFKDLISQEAFDLSADLDEVLFTYDLYKAISTNYEAYSARQENKEEDERNVLICPDGSLNSFHI